MEDIGKRLKGCIRERYKGCDLMDKIWIVMLPMLVARCGGLWKSIQEYWLVFRVGGRRSTQQVRTQVKQRGELFFIVPEKILSNSSRRQRFGWRMESLIEEIALAGYYPWRGTRDLCWEGVLGALSYKRWKSSFFQFLKNKPFWTYFKLILFLYPTLASSDYS